MILTKSISKLTQETPELKPIMEPDPIEFSFETVGWTVLLWVLIISILVIAIRGMLLYRKNKYKRTALKKLKKLAPDSSDINQQIATQLKIVAIQSYGRGTVAHLSGKDWTSFLQSKTKHTQFEELDSFLMECLYKNNTDSAQTKQFLTFSKKWIKTHA
ncbi:DUF4381 domain-containing protein [Urechidicola vernalis]|uniref:DUF4381 domain-containing protein n=1 Tax=Urechidicola vernalis TaxID=3075600 RepID=A0ABU2Y6K9_9FLAO|nr:DUF4381 domain-containing protein [Urechidicola sp. P050]MDT0553451.1 DUF4381 domain-containing protein [Urechidicola sp. P050]